MILSKSRSLARTNGNHLFHKTAAHSLWRRENAKNRSHTIKPSAFVFYTNIRAESELDKWNTKHVLRDLRLQLWRLSRATASPARFHLLISPTYLSRLLVFNHHCEQQQQHLYLHPACWYDSMSSLASKRACAAAREWTAPKWYSTDSSCLPVWM